MLEASAAGANLIVGGVKFVPQLPATMVTSVILVPKSWQLHQSTAVALIAHQQSLRIGAIVSACRCGVREQKSLGQLSGEDVQMNPCASSR